MSDRGTTIARVRTTVVELPLPRPITTSIHSMSSTGNVLVELETADGVVGHGFCFTLNGDRIDAFEAMVRGFARFVVGRSVFESAGIHRSVWEAINPTGHAGVTVSALAALDVAVWDAAARSLDQPLADVFGRCRDRIPTYATSGLWLSQDVDDLCQEARRFVDAGFRAMKIRLGSAALADDVARVAAVRDAIGPEVELLADLNQGRDPKGAIALARALAPYQLGWIEEPVAASDFGGHRRVRDAIEQPVASGETLYGAAGLAELLMAQAVDVLMPDLQRVGGYTEFRRACASALVSHVPVSTHFFTEHSLAAAGAEPGVISVEHCDWFAELFAEQLDLVDGELVVPRRSGTGFTFRPEHLAGARVVET